tara:strand:- start:47 stop:358 length:312 start_codon:yes stop_codon:yes gene_type:complete
MKVYSNGEGWFNLDWNPANYKTKAGAAKGLYKALCDCASKSGMDPKWEVWIKNPKESQAHGFVGEAWHVCWESGPFDWATNVFASSDWGHCETYWGFDLAFYD